MVVALYLIALAMIGSGAAAVAYGWGIVLNERGWTMVIAGAVVLSGGLLLLGIAVVAGRIRRIERELSVFRDHVTRLGGVLPPPRPFEPEPEAVPAAEIAPSPASRRDAAAPALGQEEQTVLKAADVIPEPAPPAASADQRSAPPAPNPQESPEPAGPAIVGTYNSGGNAYVMYSDGSIEADTPTGRYRFKSLDELKDFIASGGEGPARTA
ncbi:MAG TPA: hypothetical protein VF601_16210 [Beijerinckiaceae bacterium]|jgi:hypothetical protein